MRLNAAGSLVFSVLCVVLKIVMVLINTIANGSGQADIIFKG